MAARRAQSRMATAHRCQEATSEREEATKSFQRSGRCIGEKAGDRFARSSEAVAGRQLRMFNISKVPPLLPFSCRILTVEVARRVRRWKPFDEFSPDAEDLIEIPWSATIRFVARAPRTRVPPAFVQPMAAHVVDKLPEGREWLYEVKFDGYRALLIKTGARLQVRSRNEKDLTASYPTVAAAGRRLHADQAVVDGEIVAVDAAGRPSFQALQHRSAHPAHAIVFYAFDLLHLEGVDLTRTPLDERRAKLPAVLNGSGVLLSSELPGAAADVIKAVISLGLEGIIAKRRTSRYLPGERNADWVKLKLDRQQEFVVGGYRPGPHGIDALLVGYYEGRDLRFAGKVRAGFTPLLRREVAARVRPLEASRCPFVDLPNSRTSHWGGGVTAEQMAEMRWLTPTLVAQIRFVEWTADGHLRHAAFLGVRDDKPARRVRRET
jgi:bifunctional non-homologous end joining protein LigD